MRPYRGLSKPSGDPVGQRFWLPIRARNVPLRIERWLVPSAAITLGPSGSSPSHPQPARSAATESPSPLAYFSRVSNRG